MEIIIASKGGLMFWLALTCILAASTLVPLGSAEETQDLFGCFASFPSVEGCIKSIDEAVSDKVFGHAGQSCCKAITELGDNCWPIVFPNQPLVPFLLKAVCKLLENVGKAAPPHY